jgi:NTE family protein
MAPIAKRFSTGFGRRGLLRDRLAEARARFHGEEKVAFVLSGGGVLGSVQVGMLRALHEAGIKPDLITGCSVGGINGAAFAADPTGSGIDRLIRLWSNLAAGKPDLMPRSRLPIIAQMALKRASIHDPALLEELLHAELPARTFSELRVPFACVATDAHLASAHWFDTGPLIPALMASAALPAIYPPVDIEGRLLYDGGVVNELPLEWAVANGARKLYILQVGHLDPRPLEPEKPFDTLMHAYWTARVQRVEEDLAEISDGCEIVRLPAGGSPRVRFDDYSKGRELMTASYEASRTFLTTGEADDPSLGPTESF